MKWTSDKVQLPQDVALWDVGANHKVKPLAGSKHYAYYRPWHVDSHSSKYKVDPGQQGKVVKIFTTTIHVGKVKVARRGYMLVDWTSKTCTGCLFRVPSGNVIKA